MRPALPFALPVLCAALAACAGGLAPACAPGLTEARTAELLFGRNIDGAQGVSDADWTRFVDEEISPRFPGFTVIDGAGQWSEGPDIERERSKLLLIVLPGEPDDVAALEAVRDAYKARFDQQSVLLIARPACVAF